MKGDSADRRLLRFGAFELDLEGGELRKSGVLIHLPPQPLKVLALLARQAGQAITREEIRQQVWGDETFVDFEQGLNHCIKQIRTALGDDAEAPRYIQTLPRRGYRFLAPVEGAAAPAPSPAAGTRRLPLGSWTVGVPLLAALGAAVLLILNVAGTDDPETHAVEKSLLDQLFSGEKPDTRAIAEARWVEGAPLEETASRAGLSVSGVRKRLATLRSRGSKLLSR